jgi:putative transposase
MPEPKKKRLTAENGLSTSEPSSPLSDQQAFHQYLRALAQSAVRTVIELVMGEELDAFIGAAWGECSPKPKGYRNGTYTRDLATATGRIEEIKVPRDRQDQFHTRAFERYSRYEPHIAEGLTQMFVAGVSTHKVGEVAETLMGVARSRQRHQPSQLGCSPNNIRRVGSVLYLDGVHFSIRHGEKADSTIILTALDVDLEGNKEVLALRACARSGQRWMDLSTPRPAFTRSHSHRFDWKLRA